MSTIIASLVMADHLMKKGNTKRSHSLYIGLLLLEVCGNVSWIQCAWYIIRYAHKFVLSLTVHTAASLLVVTYTERYNPGYIISYFKVHIIPHPHFYHIRVSSHGYPTLDDRSILLTLENPGLICFQWRVPTRDFSFSNIVSKVKLATLVEGALRVPFLITTTPKCWGGRYSIPWIAPFYPWSVPYNAEC